MPWYALYWLLPQTLRSFHYENPWALWLIPFSASLFVLRGVLGRWYHQQLRVSLSGLVGARPGFGMRVVSALRFLMPLAV
ncbi:MAG: hypothetical protein EOO39_23495 [Cytophagaceae bacterium]|nr:MAG: hypothetical protein EOO39_23495 [Cytophagaceae bacterium]